MFDSIRVVLMSLWAAQEARDCICKLFTLSDNQCQMSGYERTLLWWHSVGLPVSFLSAVSPCVHALPVDIALTSMHSHTVTHLVPIPDMAAHLKDDFSHHSSLSTPPRLLGSAGSCQTQSGMQRGIRRPGICPLSVTAADWQWLPAW